MKPMESSAEQPQGSNPFSSPGAGAPTPSKSTRKSKHLKAIQSARTWLIFIGILTIVANVFVYVTIENEVKKSFSDEIRARERQGMKIDHKAANELMAQAIFVARVMQGALIGLGVLYIIFGLMVQMYPVPITVISLVLYVGVGLLIAWLDPSTLSHRIIFKIITIVALAKATMSAVEYQRERNAEALSQQPEYA